MDKEHTKLLQTLVEKYETKISNVAEEVEARIDEEHAVAVEEAFNKLDKDRSEKLVQVKEHYEGLLVEKVAEHVNVIVEGLDAFLDAFLDEHIPSDIVEEAARKNHSDDLLKQISKMVTLNESVTDEVRDGMLEAKNTIEEQAKTIDKLKRDKFLAEKTAKLPTLEKNYILEAFEGKPLEFIERQFDYVKTLSQKQEEKVIPESSQNVDRPSVVIEESQEKSEEREVKVPSAMAGWANSVANKGFYD